MSTSTLTSTVTTPTLEARLTAGPYVERYRGRKITITLVTRRRNRAGQPPPSVTVQVEGRCNPDWYPDDYPGGFARILGRAREDVDNAAYRDARYVNVLSS